MDVSGRSMISHVVERCRQVKSAGGVAVVTTAEAKDDRLADHLEKTGVDFYRGSEMDVLDRYYQAAKERGATSIVRITSDCPLVDPDVTDDVLRLFTGAQGALDYANNFTRRTYPRGLDTEVFSMDALGRAWREARLPHEREHVTPFFYETPGRFRTGEVSNDIDLSHLRWTVDEPSDLAFVRAVYDRLYKPGEVFDWRRTLALLECEPELVSINRDAAQKTRPAAR